ncbi:MAG: SDR family oxidoreductase [Clostridia bacterium]|nr:SDR family oxidoreductase [Clostridia bacterium]
MDQRYSLAGKHILVTGASSGIGRAVALRLDALGARVTLLARSEERLKETLACMQGGEHAFFCYDLSDVEGIEALIKEIVAARGKLDGMMYCAGDCLRAPLAVCKPAAVRESMQINYFAFVEMLRCVSKSKSCNSGASFVAMSSDSSMKGEKCLLTLSAGKAAMNSAVRCAAKELAPKKIRVNAIVTAFIGGTRMIGTTLENFGEEHVHSFFAENQPLGEGKPEYIADAAAFLLSDAAQFITGAIMVVDGGYLA